MEPGYSLYFIGYNPMLSLFFLDQIDPALAIGSSFKLVGPTVFDLSYLLPVAVRILQRNRINGIFIGRELF